MNKFKKVLNKVKQQVFLPKDSLKFLLVAIILIAITLISGE